VNTNIDDHRSITDAVILDSITFVPSMSFTQRPWTQTPGMAHVAVTSCRSKFSMHTICLRYVWDVLPRYSVGGVAFMMTMRRTHAGGVGCAMTAQIDA